MMTSTLPEHIAIIMDGNGRWAKRRLLPRIAGHKAGAEAARQVIKLCVKHHIKVLSLFAFSSENWRRPAAEVSFLMELLLSALEREVGSLQEHNIQLRFIGDRVRFSDKLRQKIAEVEHLTSQNNGMVLIIAADYGGQWDVCQAVRRIAESVEAGQLSSAEITVEKITKHLAFPDLPHPDLFIRTSGELRISNFMLWQLAYTELYFTDIFWPDFNEAELEKALAQYAKRERRFGYSSDQLSESAC